jgi:hypothetical protein
VLLEVNGTLSLEVPIVNEFNSSLVIDEVNKSVYKLSYLSFGSKISSGGLITFPSVGPLFNFKRYNSAHLIVKATPVGILSQLYVNDKLLASPVVTFVWVT